MTRWAPVIAAILTGAVLALAAAVAFYLAATPPPA